MRAKTERSSVPPRGAKAAPSCPVLHYTLRDFLRFSAGVWGFNSPLSHVFFPSFSLSSPRPRHNGRWVRHNSPTKERWVERREPLQLAPAVARHPLPVVAPEREVIDPRLRFEPRDLDAGVERRRHKRVLGRVEPAHAEPKGALRRIPVRQEGVRLNRGAPCVGKDRGGRLNTQRLERAQQPNRLREELYRASGAGCLGLAVRPEVARAAHLGGPALEVQVVPLQPGGLRGAHA